MPSRSVTAAVGLGPHVAEEVGVGAPTGERAATAAVGLGPHVAEEVGVGAPTGEKT